MAKKEVSIIWSKDASKHFSEILEYLSKESQQASDIVGNGILDAVESLPYMPLKYPEDRLRKNNDGRFRAVIVFSIGYLIFILRMKFSYCAYDIQAENRWNTKNKF